MVGFHIRWSRSPLDLLFLLIIDDDQIGQVENRLLGLRGSIRRPPLRTRRFRGDESRIYFFWTAEILQRRVHLFLGSFLLLRLEILESLPVRLIQSHLPLHRVTLVLNLPLSAPRLHLSLHLFVPLETKRSYFILTRSGCFKPSPLKWLCFVKGDDEYPIFDDRFMLDGIDFVLQH